MPSKEEIAKYWGSRLPALREDGPDSCDMQFGGVGKDGCFGAPTCFACGKGGRLERAHIKSIVAGGDNAVDNLHMLCAGCHAESETLSGQAYWNWLAAQKWQPDAYYMMEKAANILGFDTSLQAAKAYGEKFGADAGRMAAEHIREAYS
jgi:hypothetical protein